MSSHVIRDRICKGGEVIGYPPRTWVIYVLLDPRDGAVRYVGTTTNPYQRLTAHCDSRGSETPKGRWIGGLKARGLRPSLMVVDLGIRTREEALARESAWAKSLLADGFALLSHGVPR